MEMTMDREKQGDDRLIGLEKKVDEGFARIDERFAHVDQRFAGVEQGLARVDQDIREMRQEINSRLDGMQRAHYTGVVAIVAALIAIGAF
jgi:hypothetical protein